MKHFPKIKTKLKRESPLWKLADIKLNDKDVKLK